MKRLSALLVLVCLLAACSNARPVALEDLFPRTNAAPGWSPAGEVQLYPAEKLFDLVDGAAEGYLAYGCDQVAVGHYASQGKPALKVEIWQLASPADAYGLYTTMRSGTPVPVGSDGLLHTGRQLIFWQNRYYVRISAVQPAGDADLEALGRAVATTLPQGGERPALLKRLPSVGLDADSVAFFRSDLSIQGRLWLGDENLLQLGRDTEGMLADYNLGDGAASLLLVRYPDSAKATSALAALKGKPPDNLQAARSNGALLGAVIGTAPQAAAEQLLGTALQ